VLKQFAIERNAKAQRLFCESRGTETFIEKNGENSCFQWTDVVNCARTHMSGTGMIHAVEKTSGALFPHPETR
jgi:hypothetical protein